MRKARPTTAALWAFLALSSIALRGGTVEEEERARIQNLSGGAAAPTMETIPLYPGAGDAKALISTWRGCEAEPSQDGTFPCIAMSAAQDAKRWAGFKVSLPPGAKGLELGDAQAFRDSRVSFMLKAVSGTEPQELQLALAGLDSSGKALASSYLRLPIPAGGGWTEINLHVKDFAGAEGVRQLDGVCFQFAGKPRGLVYLIRSLKFERRLSKSSMTRFEIEEVDLSSLKPTAERFPASATNIRVQGPDIVRDGKPVFLTGVEEEAVAFPWCYRLLGLDIIQPEDFKVSNLMRCGVEGDTVSISWGAVDEWTETQLRLLLADGFALHINYWDGKPENQELKERLADSLAESSHFYTWRLDDAIGRKIKENYTKATLRTLGKYPVTFYELYNELYYGDATPAALKAFQDELRAEYGDVAKMNQALRTDFHSFDAVAPPSKTVDWAASERLVKPRPVPVELYVQWQRFSERWLGTELRKLTAAVKKELKYSNSYVIYQAVMNLSQDFSGFINTYPKELLRAEDALCHEGGMAFIPQRQGAEKLLDIKKMTKPLMVWDLLAGISPDKPVYLSECSVNAYAPSADETDYLLMLNGAWRFADDSGGEGLSRGYHEVKFDDGSWPTLNAPGTWGNQGFPKCSRGWYRRSFALPDSPSGKIFVTGKELADQADIYLNGELIHKTQRFNEAFSVDATKLLRPGSNTLAISIVNKFMADGQSQGGIRGFVALASEQAFKPTKLNAGQMRTWFWSMALHGVSGVVMSYFYTPATYKGNHCLYSPVARDYEAIRAIPEVKREINDVAATLLPRPRLKPDVAVVYSFETGRARLPKDSDDLYSGKITLSLMDYYLAALFSQIEVGVTTCDAIMAGEADRLKAIVIPNAIRVPGKLQGKLERFVADGGVLVLGPNAMSFDDDAHRPTPAAPWLGVEVGKPLAASKAVRSIPLGLDGVPSERRDFDSCHGVELTLAGATSLATFADGSPAITVNRHGKGHVYYFACNLPFPQLKTSLATILGENGIGPQLSIKALDGSPANYVEAHLLGSKGSFILYLNNFGGGDRKLKVAWPAVPTGIFKVSDIKSGASLADNFSSEALKDGLELTAPSQSPVALLLELKGEGRPTQLTQLPASDRRFLDMWRRSPPGGAKILFNTCSRDEMDPFRMLTGKTLLEDNGFEISYAMAIPEDGQVKAFFEEVETKPLSNYAIYVLPGTRWLKDAKTIKGIVDYVKGGGSLLLGATVDIGCSGWMSNRSHRKELFEAFGLKCGGVNFKDDKMNIFSPYFCRFTNIAAGHPVVVGVNSVQIAGASVLGVTREGQSVLVRSNATSVPAEAPFLVAMEFGAGRVVAMGDALWLGPEWLDKADNAQLMLNIFNWLARRECRQLSKEKLQEAVKGTLGN